MIQTVVDRLATWFLTKTRLCCRRVCDDANEQSAVDVVISTDDLVACSFRGRTKVLFNADVECGAVKSLINQSLLVMVRLCILADASVSVLEGRISKKCNIWP